MHILMTGATGLIGRELGLQLVRNGHTVVVISRDPQKVKRICPFPCKALGWNEVAKAGPIELIINLAGEAIADKRWSDEVKKRILESRVTSIAKVIQVAKDIPSVRAIISASAVGYYGDRDQEELTEASRAGKGFLSEVCQKWESALFQPSLPDRVRRVAIRVGIVLSADGGALEKMVPLFDKGIGGPIGLDRAWLSWIHEKDIVKLFMWAAQNEKASGIYNGVSGVPCTNHEFAKVLAHALGTRSKVPAPAFALKMMLGEMAEVVLQSQKIGLSRAEAEGFVVDFKKLDSAFRDLFPRGTEHESVLVTKQWVPKLPKEIFPFFSDAKNLERLTPPFLKFNVLGTSSDKIQAGTEIRYKLNIHGVPAHWLTEIQEWKPPFEFIDNQKKGPYDLWTHTHLFEELAGGTLLTDSVRFRLPLGWVGRFGGGDLVRHDVRNIFKYRTQVISDIFG